MMCFTVSDAAGKIVLTQLILNSFKNVYYL